jgi:hypothetical protein
MAVNEIAVGHVGAGKVAQAAEMRGTPVRSADNFQRAASCRHLAEQVCVTRGSGAPCDFVVAMMLSTSKCDQWQMSAGGLGIVYHGSISCFCSPSATREPGFCLFASCLPRLFVGKNHAHTARPFPAHETPVCKAFAAAPLKHTNISSAYHRPSTSAPCALFTHQQLAASILRDAAARSILVAQRIADEALTESVKCHRMFHSRRSLADHQRSTVVDRLAIHHHKIS